MKLLIIILQLLMVDACFGQNIELPVIAVKQSACEQIVDHLRLQNRIVSQTLAHDTLTTTIGVWANCSGISEVRAIKNSDTLKFYYIEGIRHSDTLTNGEIMTTSTSERCNCCFEFTFVVTGIKSTPEITLVNGNSFKYFSDKYRIFPVRFDFVNRDTVNYIDKYGRRQGKWLYPDNNNMEDSLGDSISFVGYYNSGWLKTCEYRMYYKSGKMAFEKIQTNYHDFSSTDYYENGNIQSQWIYNNKGSSISSAFYPNKILKLVEIENDSFKETTEYYENGVLKRLWNNLISQEFYKSGKLKKETLYSKNDKHIWAKYYYDNGRLMAIEYSKKKKVKKKNEIETKRWFKCYDINGNRVPRDSLINKGYNMLKG